MEKCKIFNGFTEGLDDLQTKVNTWLSENPSIEILDRQVMSTSGTTLKLGYIDVTIVIFYIEKAAD